MDFQFCYRNLHSFHSIYRDINIGGFFMLEQLGFNMVTIPLPFRLNHVNCFIAEGENGYIIIDTGLNNEDASKVWNEVIENKPIEKIIITHLHPDHYGYAGELQQLTNAPVSITKIDAETAKYVWEDQPLKALKEDYSRSNVPEKIADGIIDITKQFVPYVSPLPSVEHYFNEGDMIYLSGNCYEVIFTPGHSDGLICLYNKEKNVLFSTDHILPKITPNISYWFYGKENPLSDYEKSLQKIKKLNAGFVIPSHGKPFYDANERIKQIWAHHLERFDMTLEALGKVNSVFEVCHYLFEQELNVYEYQFAIGETLAHLEYLRGKGECARELIGGKWYYSK